MSKIDMNKPGAHKLTSSVNPILRNEKVEGYIQYIDACSQLLCKFKDEIEFVENKQRELRQEKIHFLEEDVPKIKRTLEAEDIPKDIIIDWINEIKDNYDRSFKASERILDEFSIASIEEIKNNIKELLDE